MPIEFPTPEVLDEYRKNIEHLTLKEISTNGYAKNKRETEIFLNGFREGFNRAKSYIFGLVKIK